MPPSWSVVQQADVITGNTENLMWSWAGSDNALASSVIGKEAVGKKVTGQG